MIQYQAYTTDNLGNVLGELPEFEVIETRFGYNIIGGFSLRSPVYYQELLPKYGKIFISREGHSIPGYFIEDRNRDSNLIDISGPSFLTLLAEEFCTPDVSGFPYTGSENYVDSGPAETVIKGLVNVNIGPGATADRRRGITIESDLGRGSSVETSVRFDNLWTEVRRLAEDGGIGVRFSGNEFQVFEPEDKSAQYNLSQQNGDFGEFEIYERGVKLNFVTTGGQGEGVARKFRENGDNQSILDGRRKAIFADRRDTNDDDVLQQEIDTRIEGGKEVTGTSLFEYTDTDNRKILRDFGPGDLIGAVMTTNASKIDPDRWPAKEIRIANIVREVRIRRSGTASETTDIDIGNAGAFDELFENERQIERRVTNLEGRQ